MKQTLHSLQALRGVAVLLVVWFHLWGWESNYGLSTPIFDQVRWFGFAGVDLFFALSGFVIAHTQSHHLGRPRAVPGYLFRRLWRIYPTFWVALVLSAWAFSNRLNIPVFRPGWPEEWLHWLLLLPPPPDNRYIGPAWSLTFELLFYLVFALVMLLPRRLGPWLLVAWGLVVLAVLPSWKPGGEPYLGTALSPFVLEFLGGCLVNVLIRRGVTGYGRTALVLGLIYEAVAIVVTRLLTTDDWMVVTAHQHIRVAIYGPMAVLVVYGLAAAELRGHAIAPRWLQRVGDASYSIYLIHSPLGWLAVMYGCLMPHNRTPHLGWLLMTFGACVAAGFALHFAVERPLLRVTRSRKPTSG